MKKAYEYLLLKRNGNSDGLIYDRLFFNNSKDARKEFRKNAKQNQYIMLIIGNAGQ